MISTEMALLMRIQTLPVLEEKFSLMAGLMYPGIQFPLVNPRLPYNQYVYFRVESPVSLLVLPLVTQVHILLVPYLLV